MLIKLGEIHTKMTSKARGWLKGDQSKWSKLTLGEDERSKNLKAKVYAIEASLLLAEMQ